MFDLHHGPTPNGWKHSTMVEACGLPYRTMPPRKALFGQTAQSVRVAQHRSAP